MGVLAEAFAAALVAAGPAADRAGKMDLYAWLIGSWDFDMVEYLPGGAQRARAGEWHFAWVLEGRAIQDVWLVPGSGQRAGDAVAQDNYYGSTLRTYDPRIDAWHIQWTDPVSQRYFDMTGRKEGARIVQEGRLPDGTPLRWSFNDITPEGFVWRSEVSPDGGKTWLRNVEFVARRRG
jgi:hypothetical protein